MFSVDSERGFGLNAAAGNKTRSLAETEISGSFSRDIPCSATPVLPTLDQKVVFCLLVKNQLYVLFNINEV